MKLFKKLLTKIECIGLRIRYQKGMWIHPNVQICAKKAKLKFSRNVILHKGVRIDIAGGGTLALGEGTSINTYSRIECGCLVVLGNNVLIGPNVYISDRSHTYDNILIPIKDQGYTIKGKLEIGDNTWIGIHACVIGNVKIGKGCVIGANAVVTKDIPDYSVVVGNPARIVKQYNTESGKWEK
jgi:acetyltransferase-like isoleucine patch superfamily enzyme